MKYFLYTATLMLMTASALCQAQKTTPTYTMEYPAKNAVRIRYAAGEAEDPLPDWTGGYCSRTPASISYKHVFMIYCARYFLPPCI